VIPITFFVDDWLMNAGLFLFFVVFAIIISTLLFVILAWRKKQHFPDYAPKLSIIIPTYNEEKNIGVCLDHILASDYDLKKLQIIVVDDGSTDSTKRIVKRFMKNHFNIELVLANHEGKPQALNVGLDYVRYDYVLTVDADVIVKKEFVKSIIAPFKNKKVGATNGIVHIHKTKSIIGLFQFVEYCHNNLIRSSFSRLFNNGIWFFGAAACFSRNALNQVGGFSTTVLTEDMAISLSLLEKNYDIITVDSAHYYTGAMHTLKDLFNQRMRWFYGGLQSTWQHRKLLKKSSPAIWYLFFTQWFWALFSIIIIPIIIYQVLYWLPAEGINQFWYLFRWFSLAGPIYVIYMLPVWGLNFINIFGVSAGILTAIVLFLALFRYKSVPGLGRLVIIFFYFPFTILLNLMMIAGIFRYGFSKKKHFKR
jgi:peptidoglycan-N-acetylglucosamine deacetylase